MGKGGKTISTFDSSGAFGDCEQDVRENSRFIDLFAGAKRANFQIGHRSLFGDWKRGAREKTNEVDENL